MDSRSNLLQYETFFHTYFLVYLFLGELRMATVVEVFDGAVVDLFLFCEVLFYICQ